MEGGGGKNPPSLKRRYPRKSPRPTRGEMLQCRGIITITAGVAGWRGGGGWGKGVRQGVGGGWGWRYRHGGRCVCQPVSP